MRIVTLKLASVVSSSTARVKEKRPRERCVTLNQEVPYCAKSQSTHLGGTEKWVPQCKSTLARRGEPLLYSGA